MSNAFPMFKIYVWNLDNIKNSKIKINKDRDITIVKSSQEVKTTIKGERSYSTYSNKLGCNIIKRSFSSHIKPIKNNLDTSVKSFATMDLETIDCNGKQIPIAISTAYFDKVVKSNIFLINSETFKFDSNLAVKKLWSDYFNFIMNNKHFFETIFVHNLGSFDGYFLYKGLAEHFSNHVDGVNTIIDDKNKFIQITLNHNKIKIVWKDSYRIFPVSLNELCKVFKVAGKTGGYDVRFNNLGLFDDKSLLNEFIEYSLQDSIALYNALDRAQTIYSNEHSVDIVSILSTSTLSLKIFRQNFLKTDIPILKDSEDSFIRKGYYGGATDYYKAYGKNLHYYDVNSLYPHAMLNPMPLEIVKKHDDMSNLDFNKFFGFCLAEIRSPKSSYANIPLLPYKKENRTIFPVGKWYGVYFSEELKEIMKHGYQVLPIKGYEFSKATLFNDYIKHFYQIKKFSSGPERFIAKMHLNQLYGIFGRKKELLQTLIVRNDELYKYFTKYIVKSLIEINDEVSTILIHNNLNTAIVKDLNLTFETNFENPEVNVKSNVAIAAAVTAYARIHMIKLKTDCIYNNINVFYTDTDSIFTDKVLPDNLVGKELGELKDELDGKLIQEAYFFGIKQYGYWFFDDNNQRIEKSVFAGVPRNSLSFSSLIKIFKGGSIEFYDITRFYKSFKDLSISIKNVKITIKQNNLKHLYGNDYLPIEINSNNPYLNEPTLFLKIKNVILKLLKIFVSCD
jgi:hypothetical protein